MAAGTKRCTVTQAKGGGVTTKTIREFLVDAVPLLSGKDAEEKHEFIASRHATMLQERVQLLCDRAIFANTRAELDAVLPELQTAIRDYIRYVRAIALETIPEAFSSHGRTRAFDGTLASIDFEQDLIKLWR
jgi:hypothetical protein